MGRKSFLIYSVSRNRQGCRGGWEGGRAQESPNRYQLLVGVISNKQRMKLKKGNVCNSVKTEKPRKIPFPSKTAWRAFFSSTKIPVLLRCGVNGWFSPDQYLAEPVFRDAQEHECAVVQLNAVGNH